MARDLKMGTIDPNMGTGVKTDGQISSAVADPVAGALFGKTRRAVLAALFGRPEKAYYLRELSRLAGGGLGSVQRELQGLRRAGLVGVRREGGRTFYQAIADAPLFPELVGIVRKT